MNNHGTPGTNNNAPETNNERRDTASRSPDENADTSGHKTDARDIISELYGIIAACAESLRSFGRRSGKKFSPMMHAMSVQNETLKFPKNINFLTPIPKRVKCIER